MIAETPEGVTVLNFYYDLVGITPNGDNGYGSKLLKYGKKKNIRIYVKANVHGSSRVISEP